MRIYLDDDSVATLLVRLLQRVGHDVQIPHDAGIAGDLDPCHLSHAVRDDRVLLSHNYRDFESLHDLVQTVQGKHKGILLVRKDNNPQRDLDSQGIVRAIAKLLASGSPIDNELHILNHWR